MPVPSVLMAHCTLPSQSHPTPSLYRNPLHSSSRKVESRISSKVASPLSPSTRFGLQKSPTLGLQVPPQVRYDWTRHWHPPHRTEFRRYDYVRPRAGSNPSNSTKTIPDAPCMPYMECLGMRSFELPKRRTSSDHLTGRVASPGGGAVSPRGAVDGGGAGGCDGKSRFLFR